MGLGGDWSSTTLGVRNRGRPWAATPFTCAVPRALILGGGGGGVCLVRGVGLGERKSVIGTGNFYFSGNYYDAMERSAKRDLLYK